jgi:hypothetical protein
MKAVISLAKGHCKNASYSNMACTCLGKQELKETVFIVVSLPKLPRQEQPLPLLAAFLPMKLCQWSLLQ